ncbi:tetratricopeptide repeat protein [Fodinibius halophilus]|uniref:Tetratricopeptide repeat protein n=1 Tax=Fodinibius halophilus TaxID=1736908 RepID=A0A6M1SZ40_9BACT|nr:hypothetical protein [Fodinibius halophilus]NGP88546.1 hypothetical protein [Fodinibius halophilus]
MNHLSTRIASLALAFGLFISCNALNSTSKSDNTEKKISTAELQKNISDINQRLSADSSSALLYQKGQYQIKLGQKFQAPKQRTPHYRNAQKNIELAHTHGSGERKKQIQQLLSISWSNEHNQGLQIIQSDSTLGIASYLKAAAYFTNATTLIPDSAISYKMGAQAFYKAQEPQKAIELLEKARHNISELPITLLDQLTFLYLNHDNPRKAITLYEEGDSPELSLNLLHGLSNAYISANEHQKAVSLLTDLADQKPQNIIYRQSLATELYYLATEHLDSLKRSLPSDTTSNISISPADSLLSKAENHLKILTKQNPSNLELKQRLAQFYHNSASNYQQILPLVTMKEKSKVEEQIKVYLTSSLPLLEELVEENPKKKALWQNLYQAYSYLGMHEKARKAKSNY